MIKRHDRRHPVVLHGLVRVDALSRTPSAGPARSASSSVSRSRVSWSWTLGTGSGIAEQRSPSRAESPSPSSPDRGAAARRGLRQLSSAASAGRWTVNAAPLPRLGRLEHEVAAHRPAQLARDVEPEAAALVGRPRRRRARSAGTAARDRPRATPRAVVGDGDAEVAGLGVDRRSSTSIARPAAVDDRVVEERPQHLVELVAVGEREPAGRAVLERERHVRRRPAPPTSAARARPGEHDLDPGPQRARLDPAHRQQLADHPRQPVGLLGDDPEAPVRRVRRQLLRVAADARERRLEVVRHAAQEVVLGLVELDQAPVLVLDPRVQLGVADRRRRPRSRTARTGPGRPAPSGAWPGRWPTTTPSCSPGGDEVGPDRDRVAGDDLLGRDLARVDEQQRAVDHPERDPGLVRGPAQRPRRGARAGSSPRARPRSGAARGSGGRGRGRGGCGSRRAG